MKHDIVVVGAGSAGSVVASRASENPNLSVALIEAGPDYTSAAALPDDLRNGHRNSLFDHDWKLNYEPNTSGRPQPLPRGRVTGGSSAVNTAIALRPVPEDHDNWGFPEWSWAEMAPIYRRLERDLDFGQEDHHGDAGPITIRRYPRAELTPTHAAFLDSSAHLDWPSCPDANHPTDWGAGPQPMNKLGRLRVSTAIGYLAAARHRENLTILANTQTQRIRFRGGRAVGVEVLGTDGSVELIEAGLVVVACGSVLSPGLLLRSGIGRRTELDRLGIEPVALMEGVGAHLSDHPALAVVCDANDSSIVDVEGPIIQTILRYTAKDSDQRMDAQIELLSYFMRPKDPPTFAIAAVLEQCYSEGELIHTSAAPNARPTIVSRFCQDERDAVRLVSIIDDAFEFTKSGPLATMIAGVKFPDAAGWLRATMAERIERVRKSSASGYHPCGTLRMGDVVDSRGRCLAVEGLVVADASIFPTVPRANTNLCSIAVGERIGEWLRTDPGGYGV